MEWLVLGSQETKCAIYQLLASRWANLAGVTSFG